MTPMNNRILVPRASGVASVSYQSKVLSYSPIAYWPMNETAGTDATCLVDSNQNGTYVGATLNNKSGPDNEPTPYFDGINDYLNVDTATLVSNLNLSEGTAFCWYYADDWDVFEVLMSIETSSAHFIRLRLDNGATGRFAAERNHGATRQVFGTTTTSQPSSWVTVAMTWSVASDELRLYVDGAEEGTFASGLSAMSGTIDWINVVGIASTPSIPVTGWVAGAAFWDTPLSADDILALSTV